MAGQWEVAVTRRIEHFIRYIQIQLDNKDQRTQKKNTDGRLISFDCFLLASLPS